MTKQLRNAKKGQLIIIKGLRAISCTNQYKSSKFVPDVTQYDVARLSIDSSGSSLWPNPIWTPSKNSFGYSYWTKWAANAKRCLFHVFWPLETCWNVYLMIGWLWLPVSKRPICIFQRWKWFLLSSESTILWYLSFFLMVYNNTSSNSMTQTDV